MVVISIFCRMSWLHCSIFVFFLCVCIGNSCDFQQNPNNSITTITPNRFPFRPEFHFLDKWTNPHAIGQMNESSRTSLVYFCISYLSMLFSVVLSSYVRACGGCVFMFVVWQREGGKLNSHRIKCVCVLYEINRICHDSIPFGDM